jgi:hypothetical protein
MSNPLFEVMEIDKKTNFLFVGIQHKDGEETTVRVERNEFEKWLDDAGRLDWETNTSDHTGEHVQESGKHEIWQYWEYAEKYHQSDMYDFLLVSKVGFEKLMKGVYNGIESICDDYKN